jgi:putative oxidoreductase
MFNPALIASNQVIARGLLSFIFIYAGLGKISAYAATQGYMDSMGVPGALLPLVILLEIVGGIAVLLGWKMRLSGFLLAGFSLLSALIFHSNLADQMQSILFMKNMAIAGGLLLLVSGETHNWSIDARTAAKAVTNTATDQLNTANP